MTPSCPALGWSATLSAPLTSQLAAVLAGFVFTSIVFLIGSEGRRYAHALGLFCGAFVVLGFDSHLYSVLAGSVGSCSRIWAQAVVAGGLLGVGAMAIITGVIWLLSKHSEEAARSDGIQDKAEGDSQQGGKRGGNKAGLNGVVLTMAYGVSFTITVLLGSTVYDYLDALGFPKYMPASWGYWIIVPPFVTVAIAASIVGLRKSGLGLLSSIDFSNIALQLATYGTLLYALTAAVFIGIVTDLPNRLWLGSPKGIVETVVIFGLTYPVLLFVALIHAKPPLSAAPRASKPSTNLAASDSSSPFVQSAPNLGRLRPSGATEPHSTSTVPIAAQPAEVGDDGSQHPNLKEGSSGTKGE